MKKIILASSSPRRKELLELIKIPFTVHPSKAEEVIEKDASPEDVVEQLAMIKAKEVSSYYQDGIIIGGDTIVVYNDVILGKPKDEEEAFSMLKMLQGNVHQVYSGVALVDAKTGKSLAAHQVTNVYMSSLTDDEINLYIKTKEPMDKAGSYGIQGYGALFIEKIEGDYFNVVGLPLSLLKTLFEKFGINIMKGILHPKSKV
ncbi:hypothetical protein BHF71_03230 [Vulcanibacillus modesticaldus]|uniref:dTTP/UTP pyrophosphatase n=1 Tax=Vulcanibacillus modesticaldus TaxID=337097 RepID=A0A1D2YSQ6_9BACI|nr:Maf family protein [Vulcanibacillus modesticaldus]OEF98047.1 hypothetical protein BHF71_03230 [Vulcanibacillus modesticaldus]